MGKDGNALSTMEKYVEGMRAYANNHQAVRDTGESNLRTMERQLAYMRDPRNLEKALNMFDADDYSETGLENIGEFKGMILSTHGRERGNPRSVVSLFKKTDYSGSIRVPLVRNYLEFLVKNFPQRKGGYKQAISEEMERFYSFIAERIQAMHAPQDQKDFLKKNLRNTKYGRPFLSSGPVWEATGDVSQYMLDLRGLHNQVK